MFSCVISTTTASLRCAFPSVKATPSADRPMLCGATRTFYFYPPTTPSNFCFGIGDEARPWVLALISSLRKVPARPSRPRLGQMDPSSPIEKHFVLPPILYAGCQHILLSIASYHYAEELTQPAKKGLAKYGFSVSLDMNNEQRNMMHDA
jgi:hypothetical protein